MELNWIYRHMWGLACFLLLHVSHRELNRFPLSLWANLFQSTKQRLRKSMGNIHVCFLKSPAPLSVCGDNRELPSIVRAISIRVVIQAHSPNPSPLTSSRRMFSSHLSVSRATPPLEYKWIHCPTAAVVTMSPTSLYPLTSPSFGFTTTDMGVNMVLVCSGVRELLMGWSSKGPCVRFSERTEGDVFCPVLFCRELWKRELRETLLTRLEQDAAQRWGEGGGWGLTGTKDISS